MSANLKTKENKVEKSVQPSRKGKKAWRKNVDISEVEQGLEEVRTEERLGGKIHLKESSEMFYVDKAGNETVRRAIKNKTLKIDEIMKPDSAIEPIISRRSIKSSSVPIDTGFKVRQISKTIKQKIETKAKQNRMNGILPGTHEKKHREIKQSRAEALKKAKGGYDLWDETPKDTNVSPFIEPILKKPVKVTPEIKLET
jgi:hypothetical protein